MGKITFLPEGKVVETVRGKTILSYIQELQIYSRAFCGGRGLCGSCMVKVNDGEALTLMNDAEKRFIKRQGYRLACQAKILRENIDFTVEIPKYAKYKILERGFRFPVTLNPLVNKIKSFPKPKIFWEGRFLDEYEGEMYGIALDIGTTTLVMYLVDLETGIERQVYSMLNPQIRYGDNVIDRIAYAREVNQEYLELTIRTAVNEMIDFIPVNPNHIYEMTVVGNTVMRDLFIGHPIAQLGESPYEPLKKGGENLSPKELGIKINPKGNIYALPLLGHFVGADALAVILSTEMYKREEINMAIDIGTNTEIMIGNKDKILVASCASGPAFEGAGINYGTGAIEGAIQKVEISKEGKVTFKTIGNKPPIGICGSGLIDALAIMLDHKVLDWTGKFIRGNKFILYKNEGEEIYLNGEDVDNLKLAKAAIAVGSKILMNRLGIKPEDVKHLYLAGAFGTFINPLNAWKIGMLPDISLDKVIKVGNAALEGARQVLISKDKRKDAEEIPLIVEHVRLELEKGFQDRFIEELCFSKYQ
ncbi:MAG: ASKHA domain-containing protein [Nitrososphaerales archaeon]